jgi:hypothetical protein
LRNHLKPLVKASESVIVEMVGVEMGGEIDHAVLECISTWISTITFIGASKTIVIFKIPNIARTVSFTPVIIIHFFFHSALLILPEETCTVIIALIIFYRSLISH